MNQGKFETRRRALTLPRVSSRRMGRPEVAASASADREIRSAASPISRAPNGFEVVETYFDSDGRPIARKGVGVARVARRYDENGQQVEESYFNAEGKPTARTGLGAARIAWRYDDDGKRVDAAFYGPDGAPLGLPAARKRDLEWALRPGRLRVSHDDGD